MYQESQCLAGLLEGTPYIIYIFPKFSLDFISRQKEGLESGCMIGVYCCNVKKKYGFRSLIKFISLDKSKSNFCNLKGIQIIFTPVLVLVFRIVI